MKNKKILLVEDNPDDLELILFAFKQSHIANEIIVAHNGNEAVDYLFASRQETVDQPPFNAPLLILLDLKLPGLDGKELLKQIRSDPHTRHIPVVVLTASGEEEDVFISYRLGANSYIRKPLEFNRFIEAIKQVGLYWLMLNEAPINKG
jgi:two-component system response regulator